jgi:hypothetical protein
MRKLLLLCALSAPAFGQTEGAADESEASPGGLSGALDTGIETTKDAVTRPWQFIGLDIGPAVLKTDSAGEVDKQGNFFALKTRLLFDFRAFTVEAAAGLFQAALSGDTANGTQKASAATTLLEAGGKWVLTPDIEVGGFVLWAFGEVTDFGPVKDGNKNNLFVGVQAAYDPGWFDTARGRFLATYLFDKTIVTRQFSAITIGYEMGLPWLNEEGQWMWQ